MGDSYKSRAYISRRCLDILFSREEYARRKGMLASMQITSYELMQRAGRRLLFQNIAHYSSNQAALKKNNLPLYLMTVSCDKPSLHGNYAPRLEGSSQRPSSAIPPDEKESKTHDFEGTMNLEEMLDQKVRELGVSLDANSPGINITIRLMQQRINNLSRQVAYLQSQYEKNYLSQECL
jgi:hypothetical protein